MSIEALASVPAGEIPSIQRVRQLQGLIEEAGQAVLGVPRAAAPAATAPAEGAGGFSTALQAATVSADSAANPAPVLQDAAQVTGEGAQSGEYEALINQAAQRNNLDPALLHGLIQQESGFDPSAQSGAGASGLTQLMPGTAASMGVANPLNPAESIEGGARYLGQLMSQFGGNATDALAAYNAGPGAVQQYGGVPPYAETQSYVTKVLANAESYRQSHPATAGLGVAA
jgi:soluble lytic murein transglycosylase-like protein